MVALAIATRRGLSCGSVLNGYLKIGIRQVTVIIEVKRKRVWGHMRTTPELVDLDLKTV